MLNLTLIFGALLVGHAIADFPLQAGPFRFINTYKCRLQSNCTRPRLYEGRVVWPVVLTLHAGIHGAAVALVTGSIYLGLAELAAHWLIDCLKCERLFGRRVDQALHVGCKVAWVAILAVL